MTTPKPINVHITNGEVFINEQRVPPPDRISYDLDTGDVSLVYRGVRMPIPVVNIGAGGSGSPTGGGASTFTTTHLRGGGGGGGGNSGFGAGKVGLIRPNE